MFIDSHAHLTSSEMLADVQEVLARAKAAKVTKIINICTDQATLEKGLALKEQYDWVYNTAATTPHDVEKEGESFFPLVAKCAKEKKLVAIGETGLDYHYEHSPKKMQQKFLERYLQLALDCNLPVVIHCRDAFADLFSIADALYKKERLLLHCFTGTLEEAKDAVKRGWSISFSGIVTFKKSESLREVARHIPLEHILIETDAPYLAPQSQRGKRNEPSFLPETAALLASLRNIPLAAFAEATSKNAARFFSL